MGKICPQKKEIGGEKNFVFSSCLPHKTFGLLQGFAQKRESRLGVQGTEDSQRLTEVRAPRLLGGWGEESASLPDRSICYFG